MKLFSASGATIGALMVMTAMIHNSTGPILPDKRLTPGVADEAAMSGDVCVVGYTDSVRNVSEETKRQVFDAYKLNPKGDKYEIDHLISLELGGSNNISNLWPQSYTTMPWNAHIKDKLENRLHKEICEGNITIREAQEGIADDWIELYCALYDDKQQECKDYKNNKGK